MHDYLVIWLDYGKKYKLRITMPKHIESILEAAAEDMDNIVETPAANYLFTVREDRDTLTGTQAKIFWNIVAKCFCQLSAKTRPQDGTGFTRHASPQS